MYLLSLITWIPGLILFGDSGEPGGMGVDARRNLWIAGAIFIGPVIWIMVLSLIALAISAWVRWKIAAGGLILGVFFAGAGFGAAINAVMRTNYGSLIDLDAGELHRSGASCSGYDTGTGISTCATRGLRWRSSARSACGCCRKKCGRLRW